MIDILYEISFLPVIWQVGIAISFLFITIWFQLPSVLVSIFVLVSMWIYDIDPVTIALVALALSFLTVPIIRTHSIARIILFVAQKLKIFPKVSYTERAALEAGSVWMDKELFSGAPNIKRLMKQEIGALTKEEKAFLDGPVTELCGMINDWEIQRTKKIPDHVWNFVKENKFLGMIIPKEHGGLGLSAIGHSVVIEKIASVSATMAITVMVPNSLGPAELLLHYGTTSRRSIFS